MQILCTILAFLGVFFGIVTLLMLPDCDGSILICIALCILCIWGSISIEHHYTTYVAETVVAEVTHMEDNAIMFASEEHAGEMIVSTEDIARLQTGDEINICIENVYTFGKYHRTNYTLK